MTREPERSADFATQYQAHSKEVFAAIVRDELAKGADATGQAHIYAELGKPDFALAYLLAGALPDAERRDLLAHAYERRAEHTEAKAHEFDKKFHRPFPMLLAEAAHDRSVARQIRAGRTILPDASRRIPLS
ncbi:MAG: hypothetical protein ACRDHP_03150 [Ktedonobacterales bacterium]